MLVLYIVAPPARDYAIFTDAARAVLRGVSSLYDAAAPGFYYAPWGLPLFALLSFLPPALGQAILSAASLAGLIFAIRIMAPAAPWWGYLLALGNVAIINLVGAAQVDGIIIAAVALGYLAIERRNAWGLAAALAVIGIKPTNALLPAALLVWWGIRQMGWGALKPLAAVALGLALWSGIIAGWGWPLRYVAFIQASPPDPLYNFSFWQSARPLAALGLGLGIAFVYRQSRSAPTAAPLARALVFNLFASPYLTIYHFAAAAPYVADISKSMIAACTVYGASILAMVFIR